MIVCNVSKKLVSVTFYSVEKGILIMLVSAPGIMEDKKVSP